MARIAVGIATQRKWGLKVNLSKCQLNASPYSKDVGDFVVDGVKVKCDDHLDVMGVPFFRVGMTPEEALQRLFAEVRSKFWAMKGLLKSSTPLGGRLKLMQKVLGNTLLWCAAAFIPDKQQAVNTLQVQLVVWSVKLSKGREEDWVSFRKRTFRAARCAMPRHCPERWSAWLRRVWGYAGHRARCAGWQNPPLSSHIDGFRDLS